MNLYHDLPSSPEGKPEEFHAVIDIPKGSSNKYEYDEEGGYIALDRVIHHPMFFPFDYGFIPQTSSEDGDATDICVLVTYPTLPGCVQRVRVIGMLETKDQDGVDPKIFAVPVSKVDPRWEEVRSIDDLPAHVKEELFMFFKEIKHLEKAKYPHVEIGKWGSVEETLALIEVAKKRYTEKHAK